MSFLRIPFLLLLGSCTTKAPEGTATDRPQRPIDDADTDGGDADGLIADADADADADAGSDGDTGEDSGEPSDDVDAPYALRVTPAAVNFGPVSVSTTSPQMVDIKNVGTESVHINGIGVSDRTVFDFLPSFGVPITLLPGMEKSMRIDFTPADANPYTGEIIFITEEVLDESADILLQGLGEAGPCDICSPIIDVHPSTLTVEALLCEATESLTVSNSGDRPLRITGVNIINDFIFMCGNFTRSWSGAVTIAPMGSTSIPVTYRATDTCSDLFTFGSEENTMHILSNDPSDPDYVVQLTGFALACGIF
jgi:hypothetical protein